MLDKKYFLAKIYLVLAILCFLAYANSINNGFVSDDVEAILKNPNIAHLSSYWFQPHPLLNSLSYRIAKFNSAPYHLFSIILHFLNTILVFLFLGLFFKTGSSFLSAALFAVHPIHTEAVTWISGRGYLFLTFFTLTTYLLYYKAGSPDTEDKKARRTAYLLALAIFSYFINKNYSFYAFFPFLIILSDIIFSRWRKNWKLWLPFILITAFSLILARDVIQQRVIITSFETGEIDAWQKIFFYFVYSLFSHLWLLFWPQRLTLYHEPLLFYPWARWLGFIALSILACFLPYIFKKAKSILLGMGMFVLFLAPTYIPFPAASVVAERYTYLPSIFLCILAAFFYEEYAQKLDSRKHRWLITLFIFIIAVFGLRTIIRNQDWKDEKTFWKATLKISPNSSRAHNNVGFIYLKENDMDKAIGEFNIAIKLNPRSYESYNNLANIYQNMGKQEKAIALYKRAIALNPNCADAYNNLGVTYQTMGKPEEAIALYKKAIALNPNFATAYKNLAVIYYLEKQYALAIKYCDQAMALGYEADPNFLKLLEPYRQVSKSFKP